jgi:hypothetical protein
MPQELHGICTFGRCIHARRGARNACAPHAFALRDARNMEMSDQNNNGQNGSLGIAFGAFVALAALFFIVTGGSLGGKKTVEGDKDLPPVASETAPGQIGTR